MSHELCIYTIGIYATMKGSGSTPAARRQMLSSVLNGRTVLTHTGIRNGYVEWMGSCLIEQMLGCLQHNLWTVIRFKHRAPDLSDQPPATNGLWISLYPIDHAYDPASLAVCVARSVTFPVLVGIAHQTPANDWINMSIRYSVAILIALCSITVTRGKPEKSVCLRFAGS